MWLFPLVAASTTNSTTPVPATGATPGNAPPPVRMVPVQITVPPQQGQTAAKSITVHVPAHALQGNCFILLSKTLEVFILLYCYLGGAAGAQLQTILSSPAVTAALSLPVEMATTVLQQHINSALQVALD